MKIIITENQYNILITESGIRGIVDLAKRYNKAKIYFHQDLDGVTTAIAMKNYLEKYGIKVVDAEVIQYGDKEFAIKKPDASGEVMPVLVDFAHGKPMFVIHTDHHDSQAGVEKGTSTNFRSSRSNAETISQIISPNEIFTGDDIFLISTVDSANFASNKITTDMVINYIYKFEKDKSLKDNKVMMGLVTNKLLLAFKNKPNFLETLVIECGPSLLSILRTIKRIMKENNYPGIETLTKNKEKYIEDMKTYPKLEIMGNVLIQDGGGIMRQGSYDRYTPFKNNPDADFFAITWDLGLLQVSCNPYKENRKLKGIDLGKMKDKILENMKDELSSIEITAAKLKKVAETSKSFVPWESVGFTFKDLIALYGEYLNGVNEIPKGAKEGYTLEMWYKALHRVMDKPYVALTENEIKALDLIKLTEYDVIKENSGGHKCITNIQASALGPYFGPFKTTDFIQKAKLMFVDMLEKLM